MRKKSTAIRFAMLVGLCAVSLCTAFLNSQAYSASTDEAVKAANAEEAASLSKQAELKYQEKKWNEAAKLLQASTAQLIQRKRHEEAEANNEQLAEPSTERDEENARFWRLVKVSYRAAASPVQMSETAAKMFEIAQWAQNLKNLQSIAPMATQLVKADSPLAKLLSKRKDLISEWRTLNNNLIKPVEKNTAAKLSPEDEKKAHKRKAAIDEQLKEIDEEIGEDHFKYASLTSLEPLSVENVQGLINSDEALVFFLDTPEKAPLAGETFVWVVTRNKMRWVSADIGTAELQSEVHALRCGLDASAWEKRSNCAKELGVKYSYKDYRKGRPLPFDAGRAHALYKTLFSKIEDQIKDKKLLIVPSGALTKLPFQALVTSKPQAAFPNAEGMRKTHWFARKNAMTVLPSVSSLKGPRNFAKASEAKKPYLGIGNPLLKGKGRRYAKLAKEAREKQTCGSTMVAPPNTGNVSNGRRGLSRRLIPIKHKGKMAIADRIRKEPPLPETASVICALARNQKAGEDDVLLGDKATETSLKALSDQKMLAQYQVLHFATHGVLARHFIANDEPGLILTPPEKAQANDDGFLSMSEVLRLKLDADWVILSATNTDEGKADSARALADMARVFFYAGGRSVLASHWPAKTCVTERLVTTALSVIAKDDSVVPAEAVRLAMVELIDKGLPEEAHPEYWATFVLVGEGGGAG